MPERNKAAPTEEITFPEHYYVCGADLSLRRPGFCMLEVDNIDGKANIVNIKLMSIDNKRKRNKTHGQILHEIISSFNSFVLSFAADKNIYFVREKMILNKKVPSERDVAKVVGVMDYYLNTNEWYEIYPVTIKRLIAGSGKADKSEVAEALSYYVGKLQYQNDDESDAVAVAVTWLIQHNQIKEAQK